MILRTLLGAATIGWGLALVGCGSLVTKPSAPPQAKDLQINDTTPLIHAAAMGDVPALAKLLAAGMGPDTASQHGVTPLMAAARKNQVAAVEYLIKTAHADVKRKDAQGSTALHFAVLGSSPGSAQMLIDAQAAIEVKDEFDLTPLMMAVRFASADTVRVLLKAGASVYTADPNGWTALHFAIPRGQAEIFEMILDHNPTLDQPDADGDSLLIIAQSFQQPHLVRRLIDAGAPVAQADTEGNTPLHFAVNLRLPDMVEWLIKAKAPVNAQNKLGQTPLMLAIKNQDREIIQLLKGGGANADIPDGQGRNSREWASQYGLRDETFGSEALVL